MAAFVACTKVENGSAGSATVSVSSTAGNALFAPAGVANSVAASYTTSGGGTWTTDVNVQASSLEVGIASCPSATGGAQNITCASTNGGAISAFVHEFSGMATSSIKDVGGTSNSGTGTSQSTTSLTNTNASDVFIAVFVDLSAIVETITQTGTGWTTATNGSEPDGATKMAASSGYKIVSTAAAQSDTWTTSDSIGWLSISAAYKQAAATGKAFPIFTRPNYQYVRRR